MSLPQKLTWSGLTTPYKTEPTQAKMDSADLLAYGGLIGAFSLSRNYLQPHINIKLFYDLLFSIIITGFAYADVAILTDAHDPHNVRWLRTLTYTPYISYSYTVHTLFYEPFKVAPFINTIGMFALQVGGCAAALRSAYIVATYGHFYIVAAFLTYVHSCGCMGTTTYKKYMSVLHMGVILPIVIGFYVYMGYLMYVNWYLYEYMGMGYGLCYMICHVSYVLFEAYLSAVDYGYNRALDRISRDDELV